MAEKNQEQKQSMQSRISQWLFLLLVLPLVFFNIRNDHDWGDDFAQFLIQSEQITNDIEDGAENVIYNPDYPTYAPIAYPNGFPLLLAATSPITHLQPKALNRLISASWIIVCFLFFLIARNHLSITGAISSGLILAYIPWCFFFKTEVLCEIPMLAFLMCGFYLSKASHSLNWRIVFAGLLFGFAVSMKMIAIIIPLAVGCEWVLQSITKNDIRFRSAMLNALVLGAITISIQLLINRILFPVETLPDAYKATFQSISRYQIGANMSVYYDAIRSIFVSHFQKSIMVAMVLQSFLIGGFVTGIIVLIKEKRYAIPLSIIINLIILCLYNYSSMAHRYLLIIIPFILLSAAIGIREWLSWITDHPWIKAVVGIAAVIMAFYVYHPEIKDRMKQYKDTVQPGPYQTCSVEAFDFLKSQVKPTETVWFKRARALNYYTQLQSIAVQPQADISTCDRYVTQHNIRWIAINSDNPDPAAQNYIGADTSAWRQVYSNACFVVYQSIK